MKNYFIYLTLLLGSINPPMILAQEEFVFKVTLIGTGVPPSDGKAASSILVEAGDQKMLFDVGRGASINIGRYGLKLSDITKVFITHLHGDHVLGLADLWLSSYHISNGKRDGVLDIYGPAGTKKMTVALENAYEDVIKYWIPYAKPGFLVEEILSDGIVFEDGDLKVTAFRVEHSQSSKTDPYGYKVEYKGRSIVISGDTGYSQNLVSHARGTDVLLHEVFMIIDETGWDEAFLAQLRKSHTVPEVASKVFEEVQPKLAIAYHIGAYTDKELMKSRLSKVFKGEIIIGDDLMSFEIDAEGKVLTIEN